MRAFPCLALTVCALLAGDAALHAQVAEGAVITSRIGN